MKKSLFAAAVSLMMVSFIGCSQKETVNEIDRELSASDAIEFQNALPSAITRTTMTEFKNKDSMQVYGFQTTGSSVDKIFKKQKVSYNGTKWTYTPLKFWNKSSDYEFYAIYPFNENYVWDSIAKNFTVLDFIVEDAIANQVDIMIAEKNTTKPFNLVTMNFNHILCQVNFKAKHNLTLADHGVTGVKINKMTLTGLKKKGTFTQSGFAATSKNVTGSWSKLTGEYPLPVTENITLTGSTPKALIMDLLLCPQPLTTELTIEYVISFTDGTSSTFVKSVALEDILYGTEPLSKWDINTIYTYTMTIDPTTTSDNEGDFSKCKVDWDGSNNNDCDPTPKSRLLGPFENPISHRVEDFYIWEDTNGDSIVDASEKYPVVWEDLDGDGLEEGGVDRNNDGKIDNVDGENVNNSNPACDQVSDGNAKNPNGRDCILVDHDDDGRCDKQLEREALTKYGPKNPTQYPIDWNGSFDTYRATSGTDGDAKVTDCSRLVQNPDGEFYVDTVAGGDFEHKQGTLMLVLWKDIDGDHKEEGYLGNIDGENVNYDPKSPKATNLVTDGEADNADGYDAILLRTDETITPATRCNEQLERWTEYKYGPKLSNVITFSATVETWAESKDIEHTLN